MSWLDRLFRHPKAAPPLERKLTIKVGLDTRQAEADIARFREQMERLARIEYRVTVSRPDGSGHTVHYPDFKTDALPEAERIYGIDCVDARTRGGTVTLERRPVAAWETIKSESYPGA